MFSSLKRKDLDQEMSKLVKEFGYQACQASLNAFGGTQQDEHDMMSTQDHNTIVDSILDASLDAAFLTDPKGIILQENQAARDMLGASFVGSGISTVIGGTMQDLYWKGTTQDATAKRTDGSEFSVQVSIRMFNNQFAVFLHDLTQHMTQLQEIEKEKVATEQSKQLQQAILDLSFDSIIVTSDLGTIVQVNQRTLQEFGFSSPDELVGQDISILVGGGHQAKHRMYMKRFHGRGGHSSLLGKLRQLSARRKDGSEFPCQIGIKAVTNHGSGTLIVGFIRNISREIKAVELEKEKHAAELLLLNMLPEEVAQRLKDDPGHIADHFLQATILFADIVGFTKMSSHMEPIAIVKLLNDLFSRFDERLEKYSLNKVKTIGDCYMVTSIPGNKDPSESCTAVCHFALDMAEQLAEYNQENPDKPLNIRIGVNQGPVVAGIVGTKRFLYDIWGDAVNVASRMESTGVSGKVQVTKAVTEAVCKDEFIFEQRGSVQVKGIGDMQTFFLVKRRRDQARKHWSRVRKVVKDESLRNLSTTELLRRSLCNVKISIFDEVEWEENANE